MVEIKKFNANPKNRKTTDCVVRAISVASGNDYNKVVDDLVQVWKDTGYEIGEKRTYGKVLESYGFTKLPMPFKSNGSKYRIGEVDQVIEQGMVAVVAMANHLVPYVDGMLIDTWDCRKKSILNMYVKVRNLEPAESQKYQKAESLKRRVL